MNRAEFVKARKPCSLDSVFGNPPAIPTKFLSKPTVTQPPYILELPTQVCDLEDMNE